MTDEQLEALKALADAAEAEYPSAFWECFQGGPRWWWFGPKDSSMQAPKSLACFFAAATPAVVLALVAEVERLREEVSGYEHAAELDRSYGET